MSDCELLKERDQKIKQLREEIKRLRLAARPECSNCIIICADKFQTDQELRKLLHCRNIGIKQYQEQLKRKDQEIEQLLYYINKPINGVFPEGMTLADIRNLKDANCKMADELENLKKTRCKLQKRIEEKWMVFNLLDEKNKEIKELRRQRDLLYKYAEIHSEKFFAYAPVEKEFLDLLNDLEIENAL